MPDRLDAAIRAKLAAADEIDVRYDYTDASDAMSQMQAALLAVLNGHHPIPALAKEEGGEGGVACGSAECERHHGYFALAYPCPTVRDIATALGIEVADA